MLDSKVLNTDYDLAEMSDLQRPNLLDNADFKSGIINQRGQTSYTVTNKTTCMIDRWRTFYGTLEVNDGYVKFTNTDSSSARAFEQWFSDFGDGIFTVYVNVKSLSGNIRVQLLNNDASLIEEKQLTVGENVLTASGAVRAVRFYVPIGANIEIYQVKLEKGALFTGMPVWNYEIELLKCMRKFQVQEIAETIWSDVTGQTSTRSINYFVPMENTPSISYEVYDEYNVENVSADQPTKSRYIISYVLLNDIGTGHRYGIRVFIDSENY